MRVLNAVPHRFGEAAGLTDDQIAALKEPGGRRREDLFTVVEQALLRFTDLRTSRPGNIDQADLDTFDGILSDAQVIELVLTIATANWTNQVNDGFQTPLG